MVENISFQTITYGAHETIPCALEVRVLGNIGAHEAWSCASGVLTILPASHEAIQ